MYAWKAILLLVDEFTTTTKRANGCMGETWWWDRDNVSTYVCGTKRESKHKSSRTHTCAAHSQKKIQHSKIYRWAASVTIGANDWNEYFEAKGCMCSAIAFEWVCMCWCPFSIFCCCFYMLLWPEHIHIISMASFANGWRGKMRTQADWMICVRFISCAGFDINFV